MIGLQPGEAQMRRIHDFASEVERRLARFDAAAVAAHVDLDVDGKGDPRFAGGLVQRHDLGGVVGAGGDAGRLPARPISRRSFLPGRRSRW